MNIPERNMCCTLSIQNVILFLLSLLEKSFKAALQTAFHMRNSSHCEILIFSPCAWHLVHQPCSAPPRFPGCASAHLQTRPDEPLCPSALVSWEVSMGGEHQRSPTASGTGVESIPMGTMACQAAPPTLQHSALRNIACFWGNRSSYPHSKLPWARNVAACASSKPYYACAHFRKRYKSWQSCSGFILSSNYFRHYFSPHRCFVFSCSISHTEAWRDKVMYVSQKG